ncbi:hypothetical protein WMF37_05020 [Sorangium sp. So ce291]|uniref:hypothetical protein n=1 Tax=Sorangium sp. So ce291 TaxID=3133294 RepID=UPI003F642A04
MPPPPVDELLSVDEPPPVDEPLPVEPPVVSPPPLAGASAPLVEGAPPPVT